MAFDWVCWVESFGLPALKKEIRERDQRCGAFFFLFNYWARQDMF